MTVALLILAFGVSCSKDQPEGETEAEQVARAREGILRYLKDTSAGPHTAYEKSHLRPQLQEAADYLEGRAELPQPYLVLAVWDPRLPPWEGDPSVEGTLTFGWVDVALRVCGIRLLVGGPEGEEHRLAAFQWTDEDKELLRDVVVHTPSLPTRVGEDFALEWDGYAVPIVLLPEQLIEEGCWIGLYTEDGRTSNVRQLYIREVEVRPARAGPIEQNATGHETGQGEAEEQ